jgi:hypothetical protein
VEHIIPESLGNKEHILWKGAVCDKCNNYFTTKIEKELLDQPYFVSMRHRNFIKTKKNHPVPIKVPSPQSKKGLEYVWIDDNGKNFEMIFENESKLVPLIASGQKKHMIIPVFSEPESNNYVLSRFLAKCALEYLALRFDSGGDIDRNDIVNSFKEKQFDNIRKYARFGEEVKFWPYHQRRIYSEGNWFVDEKKESQPYEILHELDLLFIGCEFEGDVLYGEAYFIAVIMGIEYVINIGGPKIDGYINWLNENHQKCPIYRGSEKELGSSKADDFPLLIK